MKKKGLKEATQTYHVSSSPVNDTLLELSASPSNSPIPTPTGLIHTAQPLGSQEANPNHFQITAPFPEPTGQTSRAKHDRLNPKPELPSGPGGSRDSASRHNRTADWVEMVERSGLMGARGGGGGGEPAIRGSYHRNPYFRRTSSFNDTKPQLPSSGQFRERSMTQVTQYTLFMFYAIYAQLLNDYLLYRLDREPFLMEVVGVKNAGRGSCIAPMPFQRTAYQSGQSSDLTKTAWVSVGPKHLLRADSKTQEPTRAASLPL